MAEEENRPEGEDHVLHKRFLVKVDEVKKIGNPSGLSPHPFLDAVKFVRTEIAPRMVAMDQGFHELAEYSGFAKASPGKKTKPEDIEEISIVVLGTEVPWVAIISRDGDFSFELRLDRADGGRKRYTVGHEMSDSEILELKMPVDALENYMRREDYIRESLRVKCYKVKKELCDRLKEVVEVAVRKAQESSLALRDAFSDLRRETMQIATLKKKIRSEKHLTR